MTKDRIEKELTKVHEQLAALQIKARDLEEQRQMAEDAESMKIIKKHKISPEQLQYLEQLSEDEILFLLEEKNKKNVQKTEIKEILTDEKEEIE